MAAALTITTDKPAGVAYAPDEPIVATVNLTGAPVAGMVHIAATVHMLDGTTGTIDDDVPTAVVYTLAPVPGYTITQDPAHPAVFTLTPAA